MTIGANERSVVEYIRADGSNPHRDWFDSLNPHAAAKVAVAVARLELGNMSRVKWIGKIGEYRIDWGPGYRIYLAQEGSRLTILLGGGTKRRQSRDIERAKAMWAEYRKRQAQAADR